MSKPESFLNGLPTKIDVDALVKQFGVPKEGDSISMDDIAKSLRVPKQSHRFRTVCNSWRKRLFRENNVLLVAPGDGTFTVADPEGRIDYSSRKVQSGRRAIGKAIVVAYQTDHKRLDEKRQEVARSIVGMNEAKLRLAAGVMPKC